MHLFNWLSFRQLRGFWGRHLGVICRPGFHAWRGHEINNLGPLSMQASVVRLSTRHNKQSNVHQRHQDGKGQQRLQLGKVDGGIGIGVEVVVVIAEILIFGFVPAVIL